MTFANNTDNRSNAIVMQDMFDYDNFIKCVIIIFMFFYSSLKIKEVIYIIRQTSICSQVCGS